MYNFRFKQVRERLQKTQKEIALLLNTTQQQFSRWELSNTFEPKIIVKLCHIYDVSADYLLGLSDIKKRNY